MRVGDAMRSRCQDSTRGAPGRTGREGKEEGGVGRAAATRAQCRADRGPGQPGQQAPENRAPRPPPRSGLVHAAGGPEGCRLPTGPS